MARRPVDLEGLDIAVGRNNLNAVPDSVLFRLQRRATLRFHLSPRRIWRVMRDHPRKEYMLRQVFRFLYVALRMGVWARPASA